ncbi:MAG: prephenate dehydrogenase [Alicyclobacillaceae bacterium]|nr:prephenate dehydrogenase [Alicyclobacillaceae bacterium]
MHNHADGWRPRRVLVIGCGLVGTSFALALREAGMAVDGVDINREHRETARRLGAVDAVAEHWVHLPSARYDLAVLAVPVDAACRALPEVAQVADVVMDVCSVKVPVCEVAEAHRLTDVFAPTHPMAGLAAAGPAAARASLFAGQTWLFIEGWPRCEQLHAVVESVGARPVRVESARYHDDAMAVVSHAVHLVSAAAMLASEDALGQAETDANWALLSGPGFRDVTRVSGAPAGFWVSTLLANREPVVAQIRRTSAWLERFADVLARADGDALHRLLSEAHEARKRWEELRERG